MLLQYSKYSKLSEEDKQKFLNDALKEFRKSLAAHKSLDALESREQYYEFIIALYKISCVLEDVKHGQQLELKIISMALFYHYCCNQTSIVHDDNSKKIITIAMNILDIPIYIPRCHIFYGTTLSYMFFVQEQLSDDEGIYILMCGIFLMIIYLIIIRVLFHVCVIFEPLLMSANIYIHIHIYICLF